MFSVSSGSNDADVSAAMLHSVAGKVRPLASTAAASAESAVAAKMSERAAPGALPDTTVRVGVSSYVGSPTDYLFFRLLQLLCERLSIAKNLCRSGQGFGRRRVAHVVDREQAASSSASSGDATGQQAMDGATGAQGVPEEDPYQQFLTVLYAVIDSSMDPSRFEEECRRLAGTHAFQLYTLDRVAKQCVQHLTGSLHDGASAKVRQLYELFLGRMAQARAVAGSDSSKLAQMEAAAHAEYRANAAAMVSQRGDDWYQVQYVPDPAEPSTSPRGGSLSIAYIGRVQHEA